MDCFMNKKSLIKYLGWYYIPGVMNTIRNLKCAH